MSKNAKGAAGDMLATITSDDVNYLVYRYMQESGFNHSAFSFGYESFVTKSNIDGSQVPPGALISFLQKGLQYCEVEAQVASDGPDEVEPPTTLLQAASDMVSGARRKPKRKRQRTKDAVAAPPATSAAAAAGDGDSEDSVPEKVVPVEVAKDECRVLRGHGKEVFVCSWNQKHALLASGSGDSSARIWDLSGDSTGCIVLDHNVGPTGADTGDQASKDITTIDWNSDGSKLATGCYDGLGRVWSRDGKLLTTLQHHKGPIFSLKWNARSDMLLSGSVDKTAIIWWALPTFTCPHIYLVLSAYTNALT